MIDDHKERRRFLHVTRISGFMYKLNLMTFTLRIFFRHFLLTHTLNSVQTSTHHVFIIKHPKLNRPNFQMLITSILGHELFR